MIPAAQGPQGQLEGHSEWPTPGRVRLPSPAREAGWATSLRLAMTPMTRVVPAGLPCAGRSAFTYYYTRGKKQLEGTQAFNESVVRAATGEVWTLLRR